MLKPQTLNVNSLKTHYTQRMILWSRQQAMPGFNQSTYYGNERFTSVCPL